MITLSFSLTEIKLLEDEKNIFGKQTVKLIKKFLVENATDWKKEIQPYVYQKQVAFVLPDSQVYLRRFQIPGDVAPSAVKASILAKVQEVIPVQLEDLVFDIEGTVTNSDRQRAATFIGVKTEIIRGYLSQLRSLHSQPVFAIPEFIAMFFLIKNQIASGRTAAYICPGKDSSTLIIFDAFGPIISQDCVGDETTVLTKIIAGWEKEFDLKISQIYLKEGTSTGSKENGWKKLGLPVIMLDDILTAAIAKLGIKTEFKQSLLPWSPCLGLLELTKNSRAMNLIKEPKKKEEEKKTTAVKKGNIKVPKRSWIFLLGLIFVIGVGLMIFNFRQITFGKKERIIPSPAKVIIVSPTGQIIDKKKLKIKILNGSGRTGLASQAAELLLKEGYQNIQTGNADRYDYKETVVRANDEKKLSLVTKDLAKSYSIASDSAKFDTKEDIDVLIILGKK